MGQFKIARNKSILLTSHIVVVLISFGHIVQADKTPWQWIVIGLAVGFLLLGPFSWLSHPRLSASSVVAVTTAALAGMSIIVGLLKGFLVVELYASILGGYIGCTLAVLVERTVLPTQYRTLLEPKYDHGHK